MSTIQLESDTQLLARFGERADEDAFRAIVERHAPKVYGCCVKILGDAHAADDATQAVFLLLAQKARTLPKEVALAGWLYRDATRTALEARRASAAMARTGGKIQNSGDESLRTELAELLAALPAVQGDAIVLHFLDGRGDAEIAAELGCPAATIETRISRGLEKLRDGLQKRGFTVAADFVPVLIKQFTQTPVPPEVLRSIRLTAPGRTSASLRAVEFAEGSTRAAQRFALRGKFAVAIGVAAVFATAAGAAFSVYAYGRPAKPAVSAPSPEIQTPKTLWEQTLGGNTVSHLIAGKYVLLSVAATDANAKDKNWIEARRIADGKQVWTSPVAGTLCYVAESSVVCAQGESIFSIDIESGKERWRLKGDSARPHSPLVGEGGEVFTVASQTDGKECSVCCLDPENGATLWEAAASIGLVKCAPCVDSENVYAVGEAGIACVSRRQQRVLWSQRVGAIAAPACIPGRVIIPARELTCLSGKNGAWAWSVPGHLETSALSLSPSAAYTGLQRAVKDASLAAGAEGQAYTFAAVNPDDGKVIWERAFPAEIRAGAAVTAHSVYVTCWDDSLYCLNSDDGAVRWRLPVALKKWSPTPLLASDRMLLCFQNRIICIGQ